MKRIWVTKHDGNNVGRRGHKQLLFLYFYWQTRDELYTAREFLVRFLTVQRQDSGVAY